nr:hypothetical protein [Tanacetum cinerariifolium]
PPLLPIPLSTPSTSRRAGILEADTPPQMRPLLATPRPGCERQAADDFAVQHIMRTQALEAGARDDTLEDAVARTCSMHVPWVLCMRTVASISATGIPQKSLIDHGLHSFWSHIVRVVWVGWWCNLSPSGSGHDLSPASWE